MGYNIDFEIAAVLFLLILFIIMQFRYPIRTTHDRYFHALVFFMMVSTVLDIATAITIDMASQLPLWFSMALNTLYFFFSTLDTIVFAIYVSSYLETVNIPTIFRILNPTMLGLYLILIVANLYNGCLFFFANGVTYTHGSLYYAVYLFPAYYILFSFGMLFRKHATFTKSQLVSIFVFSLLAFAGMVAQIFLLDHVLVTYFALALALLIMIFSLETPDYRALMETMDELERTRAEEVAARNDAEMARHEAEKANQAKSAFLASMSHEIRTPMNVIMGFSELAMQEDVSKEVRSYLMDIKTSSGTLLTIINEILDISKIESGKMELSMLEYDLGEVLHDVSLIIENQAGTKGLEYQCKINPSIPGHLLGDGTKLREILINLLNNAVKYTEYGSIHLAVDMEEAHKGQVILLFHISDTGIGIRAEDQGSIFDSFQRVDEEQESHIEGTGLGLAITKTYVEMMGGEIDLDSVYGKGSTFHVQIPQEVVDPAPVQIRTEGEQGSSSDYAMSDMKIRGVRVLVVDDNAVNRIVIEKSMKHYGLEVDLAASGMETIEKCKSFHYPIVFLDQMMPKMSGLETMKALRRLDAYYSTEGESKIVALTANALSGVREELLDQGFDEYLSKPMNYARLEGLLRQFLPEDKIELQDSKKVQDVADIEDRASEMQTVFPELDVAAGLRYFGNTEDYLSILWKVYTEGMNQILSLKGFLRNEDYQNFTIMIHAIKGSCLNIGADTYAKQARELELAGKKANYSYIEEKADLFVTDYKSLLQGIASGLAKAGFEGQMEETRADIRTFLLQMEALAKSYDIPTLQRAIRLKMVEEIDPDNRKILRELSAMVDDVDIDGMVDYLDGLLETQI